MFDMSLSEMAVIVTVAVVAIGPKDLPKVIRAIGQGIGQLREMTTELRAAFRQLSKESGLEETHAAIQREVKQITGDDGKLYEAYSLPDRDPAEKPPHD